MNNQQRRCCACGRVLGEFCVTFDDVTDDNVVELSIKRTNDSGSSLSICMPRDEQCIRMMNVMNVNSRE